MRHTAPLGAADPRSRSAASGGLIPGVLLQQIITGDAGSSVGPFSPSSSPALVSAAASACLGPSSVGALATSAAGLGACSAPLGSAVLPPAPAGLVTCAITSRGGVTAASAPADAGSLWAPRFPSGDLVGLAADLLGSETPGHLGQRIAHRIVVSPGSVQLKRRHVSLLDFQPLPLSQVDDLQDELVSDDAADLDAERPRRGVVGHWSSKSRAHMVRRLVSLDYSPWMESGRLPALVTLTLPGEWLRLAPDGAMFMRLLQTWRKRYERTWGPLTAIWKREFQLRGAPHFHLLMVPPVGRTSEGETFSQWLSRSWAEVCGAEGEEYEKHLRAGTGIDYREAIAMRDPKRLAIYFLKKESATSGTSSKEYQHRVPTEWDGKPVGRWWGYWGLKPATVEVELTPEEWVTVARTLRRYSRAQGRTKTVTRMRNILDAQTGEVRRTVIRKTTVRQYFFKGAGGGFLCVNDGPAFAEILARLLGPDRTPLVANRLSREQWVRVATHGLDPGLSPSPPARHPSAGPIRHTG